MRYSRKTPLAVLHTLPDTALLSRDTFSFSQGQEQ
jgi:hypothetical protein